MLRLREEGRRGKGPATTPLAAHGECRVQKQVNGSCIGYGVSSGCVQGGAVLDHMHSMRERERVARRGAPLAGRDGADYAVSLKRDSFGNFGVGEHGESDGASLDRVSRRCRQCRAGCGGGNWYHKKC